MEEDDARPASRLNLELGTKSVQRGTPLQVRGHIRAGGKDCAYARIDIALRTAMGELIPVGSVAANADGEFDAEVTVAPHVPLGDYRVHASSPGTTMCAPSSHRSTP